MQKGRTFSHSMQNNIPHFGRQLKKGLPDHTVRKSFWVSEIRSFKRIPSIGL